MSSGLTQNDACGFGATDARITAAAIHFVAGVEEAAASHIASITDTTRSAYIMKRTGSAMDSSGRRPTSAHGIGNAGRPATWRVGPIEAISKTRKRIIRNFPIGSRQ